MTLPKYLHSLTALTLLMALSCFCQDTKSNLGIGMSFGAVTPLTDIEEHHQNPYGRAFARIYSSDALAFEFGLGLSSLEAEDQNNFFSSQVYSLDVRLLLQPVREGSVLPYVFGGVALTFFNPVDQNNQPLLRNSRDEYRHAAPFLPVGGGIDFQTSDVFTVGLTGAYHIGTTDNLDDIKTGGNDNYWSIGFNLIAYFNPIDNDLDKDSLLNDEEIKLGTDPRNPDTDGDGLRDGAEVRTYHTDPLKKDTDGDGLNDGEEIFAYHTDPLNKDTDGDGLTDGDEVHTYQTDPLNKDTDGDGLTDGDEVLKYRTDPLKRDTDGDSLTDGEEVLMFHTDPLKVDTDTDGLSDGDEVHKYKTDPLKVDTDAGGMPDGKEVQLGLNPLDPADDVPIINVGERIILEGVNFETAKTTLLPGAKVILDQVANSLSNYPAAEVAIHGHTDNVGGAKYNMQLSIGRAEAVKTYLVSKGIPAARIKTKGFGFTKPVSDNSTAEGRAKNRRIEFVRLK